MLEWLRRNFQANRIVVALAFVAGLAATLSSAIAELHWTTVAASVASLGLIATTVLKFLSGWQSHEQREAESTRSEARDRPSMELVATPGWSNEFQAESVGSMSVSDVREGDLDQADDLIGPLIGGLLQLPPQPDVGNAHNDLMGQHNEELALAHLSMVRQVASGLSTSASRLRARRLAVSAAMLMLRHANEVHYTEGAQRWEGIARHLRHYRGEYPKHADCSSTVTWLLWDATRRWNLPDFANGEHWLAGYTGTLVNHGQRVHGGFLLADLALYGDPFGSSGHVAMLVGKHQGVPIVFSHGSEAGPFLLPLNYRPDLYQVRRFIL